MTIPLHSKDAFFKYYTAAAAKLTLDQTTRKWSTPFLFNDPFDNQFDLLSEEANEACVAAALDRFHQVLRSPTPLKPEQFGSVTQKVEYLRQVHQANPGREYADHEIASLKEGVAEGMQKASMLLPKTNAEIRRILADTTVLCVSEAPDNLLMWSHYAQNHTGAVIKFLALREVDSPLLVAQPVRYVDQQPAFPFLVPMGHEAVTKAVYETFTLSKGKVWSYEKEWRVVASLRDKTKKYELLPFAPQEVGAVYLGCKMAEVDRCEIIEMVRCKYPEAKILQAKKHDRKFALIFDDLA